MWPCELEHIDYYTESWLEPCIHGQFCNCDISFCRPGSHTIQWEESECLASLVDLCVVVGEETCSEARDICMSSG